MNRLKKALLFLIVFAFMSPPKAAAESLSYGAKVGFATSFARWNDKHFNLCNVVNSSDLSEQYQLADKLLMLERSGLKIEPDSRIWNPSFGASLYIEYAFNEHIGLGAELLYNRFDVLFHM